MEAYGNLGGGIPLLAKWTTEWDCGYETNWWYCVIDKPFNVKNLNAKKRYEITKGTRNFRVNHIDPKEYVEKLFRCHFKALEAYDTHQTIKKESFIKWCEELSDAYDSQRIFAAFDKETNELCAFLHVPVHNEYAALSTMKSIPSQEKRGVNAALVYGVIDSLKDELDREYFYLTDGERSVNHKTNFQAYLEKYFCFRRAYCKLHIEYAPFMKFPVNICRLFKTPLQKLDSISYIHLINALLTMNEYSTY